MIGILDYGFGNLFSVSNSLNYLGLENSVVKTKEEIEKVDKLILPGVGAFRDAIDKLKSENFDTYIYEHVGKGKDLLGICLGMQLLFEKSYENGIHEGLGILKGDIIKINDDVKVPHVGFNLVKHDNSALYKNIDENPYFYFVHSYHLETNENIVTGKTLYSKEFPVSVGKNNIMGVQYHPEKSGNVGLRLLENFSKN